jgi:MEMO1 family protein
MLKVKRTNVAGTFYPGDPESLQKVLLRYIAPKKHRKKHKRKLKALIVPHAGYNYSGPVAGTAYSKLAEQASSVGRIAVLSPTHYFYLPQLAVLNCTAYETPLGPIVIDEDYVKHLIDKKLAVDRPEVFEQEHSLEVHLPFIKQVAPYAMLVPLIIGQSDPENVQKIVDELIRQDVFIIISTDLSHFHSYKEARKMDRKTKTMIESLDYDHLNGEMACGHYPLSGLLKWAAENNGKIETLDLKNSGDTGGDKSQVVGYGSFALYV